MVTYDYYKCTTRKATVANKKVLNIKVPFCDFEIMGDLKKS